MWVRVAALSDVPPGALADVEAEGEVLVLANVEGAVFALGAWCPHLGTNLVLGQLSGPVLMCSAHLWRFDVRSGQPIWPPLARVAPGYGLRRYPVEMRGEDVYVEVS
jgi:nitrite reductase/ring-hydroxylating ferredoxin subunit